MLLIYNKVKLICYYLHVDFPHTLVALKDLFIGGGGGWYMKQYYGSKSQNYTKRYTLLSIVTKPFPWPLQLQLTG